MSRACVLFILSGFVVISVAQEITHCRDLKCQEDTECIGIPCVHGKCDESGQCLCEGCWVGVSCDTPGNPHTPYFVNTFYDVSVKADHPFQTPLLTVEAIDEDKKTCLQEEDCECAKIKYTILEGNELGQFSIDTHTGEIFADALVDLANGVSKRLKLTVGAKNEGFKKFGLTGTKATVVINIGGGPEIESNGLKASYLEDSLSESFSDIDMNGDMDRASRTKRDISAASLGVSNVTFHLSKTGNYSDVTTLRVGSKVHFQLAIQFPQDTTDILVELFTPDNETTIMALCNVEIISIGSAIKINEESVAPADVKAVMEAKTEDSYDYDRAIYAIGNVTNDGTALAAVDEMIVIEWDVVMIDSNSVENGSSYWVSAGAEYDNEQNVWVGQASFMTIVETFDVDDNPIFNYTGPEEVAMGSTSVFQVDMYIPYPAIDLTFDIFAPINDTGVMSICNAMIVETGEHYSCIPKDKIETTLYKASDNENRNSRARVNIGYVVNAGIHEAPFNSSKELNKISVAFAVQIFNSTEYINNMYWLGVAVEIGPDLIWAAQLGVTVVESDTLLGMLTDPSLKLTSKTEADVMVGQTVLYELNMTLPQNSEGMFELEVLAPYNDSARMKLCDVRIAAQGLNVPCFEETFPVYSSRDSSNISDRIVWPLGRIRNTGQREVSLDPYADVITFIIAAQVLNHSLNEVGKLVSMTAGMQIDSNKLWVGTTSKVIAAVNETVTAPTFNMEYGFGTDQVETGGAAVVEFEIITKPESLYDPMSVEFIMPYENNSAVMRICRAEVISKGLNLPCFDRVAINSSITYSSKNNDDIHDMAVVSLGTVCNTKASDDNDTTEDKIVLSVVTQLQDHVNLENGDKSWVSAGVSYTKESIYIGQMAMFTVKDMKASYNGPGEPYFSIVRTDSQPNGNLALSVGLPATYLMTIKTLPQARADYTVTVTAANGLSVCLVRVKEVGWNMPCVDSELEANYTQYADSHYSDTGKLIFGPITNVASEEVVQNETFDNNTVTVEIIVMAFTAGSPNLQVSVDFGPASPGSPKNVLSETFTATELAQPLTTLNDSVPTFNLSIAGVNENQTVSNEMAKGQAYLFNLDIYPPAGSQNHMLVKFLTPVNYTAVMEICSVNMVFVGKNIPCLKKQVVNQGVLYESRNNSEDPDHSYTDVGSIDLGHVCHFPVEETDPENNLVRVEAVAKITVNNSLSVGDKIWFSATVRLNEDQIYVSQMVLTVTDNFENTKDDLSDVANVTLNTTSGALEMTPGDIYDLFVHVTMPANESVMCYLDVRLPFDESAVMTVHHIEMVEAGENIGCLASNPDKEITTEYNSTGGSTQHDYVKYDFKIITNSGVTYRKDTYEAVDDTFVVLVQIQMADAVVSAHSAEFNVSIGVKFAETIVLVEKTAVVIRDGTENPSLLLTAEVNTTKVYTISDSILINAMLQHTNESRAEGYNVTASFYFPSFMTFEHLVSVNFTAPEVTDSSEGHGLQFKFERLYFTDIVAFTFMLKINGSYDIPLPENPINATTPFEAGAQIIHRTNHHNEANTWFVTRVDSLAFGVIGPGGIGCDAVPLGMQDGHIQDCQIQGSESPDNTRLPKHGRKGGSSAWTAGTRVGEFSRYMQVDFGNRTLLTGLTLSHQQGGGYSRIDTLQLLYSDDSINWDMYPVETLTADPPAYSETTLSLAQNVEARYVRLVLLDDQTPSLMPSVQVEFHGCTSTTDKTPQQVCDEQQTSWMNQEPSSLLYSRSLLVVGSNQFFCDTNPTKNNKMECFTKDSGVVVPLDESVVTVIGYDGEESELYALAWDKRSIVTSSDSGETWMSVSQERYTQAKQKVSWVPAAEVKYIKDIIVNNFTPVEAKYDGIYESSTRVTRWDTCC